MTCLLLLYIFLWVHVEFQHSPGVLTKACSNHHELNRIPFETHGSPTSSAVAGHVVNDGQYSNLFRWRIICIISCWFEGYRPLQETKAGQIPPLLCKHPMTYEFLLVNFWLANTLGFQAFGSPWILFQTILGDPCCRASYCCPEPPKTASYIIPGSLWQTNSLLLEIGYL